MVFIGNMERSESLSRLTKRLGKKEPKVIDISAWRKEKMEFELLREYETMGRLLVHSAEDLSTIVGELSAGSCVTVLSIGKDGHRLKVTNALGTVQGWICSLSLGKCQLCKTDGTVDKLKQLNSSLRSNSLSSLFSDSSLASRASRASKAVSLSLTRLAPPLRSKKDLGLELNCYPNIGDKIEAVGRGRVTVRSDESMTSPQILKVEAGTQLRILDYGTTDPYRLKVSVAGKTGWVSISCHIPEFRPVS